jgi:predicted metal-dependent TIM-barrel fold hydrolase
MRHHGIVRQVRLASLPLENSTGQEQALYAHQEQIKNYEVYKSVTPLLKIHISMGVLCHTDILKETPDKFPTT